MLLRDDVSFNILRPTRTLASDFSLITIKATHRPTGTTATVIHRSETFGKQIAMTELERKIGNGQ